MASTIILILCIMLPSIISGYCLRWAIEEEQIANKIKSNKLSPSIQAHRDVIERNYYR